jgi:endogenous inhibitor of DNA gyrase (YacG/DUF329 family)
MVMYIIEEGCPLCGADVKGNEEYSYYCKQCNLLFQKKALARKRKKAIPPEEEKKIEKEIKEAPVEYEDTEPLEQELRIVASAKSNKMHIETCHFLKKIQKDNWIYLDSLDEGIKKKYEPCVCIRRKGLMKP